MRTKTKTTSWLNELPKDVKAKLSALCRHHGEALRNDLAEIVRAYYAAKKLSLAKGDADLLDQATANSMERASEDDGDDWAPIKSWDLELPAWDDKLPAWDDATETKTQSKP